MCQMAVSKSSRKKHQSYISVPSQIINSISQSSLESLLHSPKKKKSRASKLRGLLNNPRFLIFLIFAFCSLWMLKMWAKFDPKIPFSRNPCFISRQSSLLSRGLLSSQLSLSGNEDETVEKGEFWKQPDGMGYRPCLDFSGNYRTESDGGIVRDRSKYLLVVVATMAAVAVAAAV